jgi:hypothetical protein
MKKRLFILMLAAASTASMLFAQQDWSKARQEIHDNIRLSASNLLAYVDPTEADVLTPTPKGYEPFYMSHYGRHGSRWLCGDGEYTDDVLVPLRKARDLGKLTATGLQLLSDVEKFYVCCDKRAGDLTTVGERQHHRIGKRMTERFPAIFGSKNSQVDARSTVVKRCIMSMMAECEELTAFNPKLRIHNDVGDCFQYYLAPAAPADIKKAIKKRGDVVEEYRQKFIHPERFIRTVFNDEVYVRDSVQQIPFMRHVFNVCSNMQSHDNGIDMYRYFTEDECYDIWRAHNIEWYTGYGATPLSDKRAPLRVSGLLKNFIETADTIVNNKSFVGATLRFGHEVYVLPMATLMELGDAGVVVSDLDRLDYQWANYRIFPMASNVQLIFYRPKKGKDGDVLVKALLNEREVTLPGTPVTGPYYKWDDLRAYYLQKMATVKN